MLDDLQLHPHTRQRLELIQAKPSQGYLFVGPVGSGRRTVAERLARVWAKADTGLVHTLESDIKSIGIEAVSQLKPLLNQKVTSGQYRTLIIDGADRLTLEAQNNLLKILEEPPTALRFIMIAGRAGDVLPTILSRLQVVTFHPVAEAELIDWFVANWPETELAGAQRLYHLGNHSAGGMLTAANVPSEMLELAKQFLQAEPYMRSQLALQLHKAEREQVAELLANLARLAEALLQRAIRTADTNQAARWGRKLDLLLQARKDLVANVNQRLILTQLVVEL